MEQFEYKIMSVDSKEKFAIFHYRACTENNFYF